MATRAPRRLTLSSAEGVPVVSAKKQPTEQVSNVEDASINALSKLRTGRSVETKTGLTLPPTENETARPSMSAPDDGVKAGRSKRGRTSKQRSKSDERDIARRTGGRRHWADVGGGEDVEHADLCIQVKGGGAVVTQVMRDGMASAKAASVGSSKLPCVVLIDRRGTRLQRYIVFELDTWCAYHGYGEACDD